MVNVASDEPSKESARGGSPNGSIVAARLQPHILMVDDDPFMLEMQRHTLQGMGYSRVATVGTGPAALARMRGQEARTDIVMCDLNMPGMDGIEFLQTLNETGSFRGHVILVSGEGLRIMHTVRKLLGVGGLSILGAIEKPAGRLALGALLDRWTPVVDAVHTMSHATVDAAELEVAAREAQWLLHYQPKVDLQTGAFTGVEALVRWNHPRHGLIAPDRFIGLAEECGVIEALTDWVLRAAMQQLRSWQSGGLRIQMAINLSMENVRRRDFAHGVGAIARRIGVSPRDVTLEITESRLMSPTAEPLESLVRLRLQRFGLSIDDFGTGHSSLAQLRDVPFTELKVDRGFVRGARDNQIIRPMLEGSIGIAKRLGMSSVAEGVETEEDWRLLREVGCDFAQGWFIARAMLPEQMPEWTRQWAARSALLTSP